MSEKPPVITDGHCELTEMWGGQRVPFMDCQVLLCEEPTGRGVSVCLLLPHPLPACLISLKFQWKHWVGQTLALKLVPRRPTTY